MARSIKDVLAAPSLFDVYQRVIGAHNLHARFIDEWVKPKAGDRILDIGCGTGAVVPFLPDSVELVGIDVSEAYIGAANARYGNRATFRVADASDLSLDLGAPYDVAYAAGVLHHIPDDGVQRVVAGALARLRPGGRFVAIDPTLVPGQGWISRKFVEGDRGEYVRSPDALASVLNEFAPSMTVVTDMLRIPFAQVITTIAKP
jgi:SAM-dependent methyltransferase